MTTISDVLPFTLSWEGNYVNDPDDSGGATNKGVTQATYDFWRRSRGYEKRSVRYIEKLELEALYERDYFRKAHCQELSLKLAQVTFDAAVHHGPWRSIYMLQRVVRTPVDGIFGPMTRAAVNEADERATLIGCCDERQQFMTRICVRRARSRKFWKGWLNRVDALRTHIDIPVPPRRTPPWEAVS